VQLFKQFIVRRLAQERLRTAVAIGGIALGIAVVVAIRLANQSSVSGFASALDAMSGAASLEIVAPAGGIDEQRLADLGWLAEFGAVSPVIEGDVLARFAQGSPESMRVLGVDVLRDLPFRDYRLIELSGGQPRPQEFLRLLIDPDAVVLTGAFANRHGLRVDDRIELDIGDRRKTFVIRGLLRNEGPASVSDGNFVLMDIAAAQWAFDRLGRLDRVEIRLRSDADVAGAEQAIARRLPAGLQVERPARRGAQVETMLRAFHFNLTALAWVALLVGLFLVYNTVAVSVIARREEIGMLRALGTPRRQIVGLFLGEAAALSAVGSAIGAGAGWLLAHAAVGLTSTTVNTLYVATAARVPALAWQDLVVSVCGGVLLSFFAAAAPALEASRVTPLTALRSTDRLESRYRPRVRHVAAGAGCLGIAVALSQMGPVNHLPIFGFAAAVAVVFGVAFLVPLTLVILSRAAGRTLTQLFGIEGALAHANLAGAIPRLAVSVAALAVALSMMVAIAIMIGSFRETVTYWVGQTLQADLYLATARRSSLDTQATVSPELEQIIEHHPSVAAIDRFRSVSLVYDGRLTVLGAGDFPVLLRRGHLLFKEPANGGAAIRAAIGTDSVLVSEAFATKGRIRAGDTISLETPHGARPFRVTGVYYDYTTDRGVVAMDRATFTRHYGDLRPTSLSVYLVPGASPEHVRDALLQQLGDAHRIFIHTNRTLRTEVLRIFDSTFAITYALEGIAIVVAIMGVSSTLLTLILERRRDLTALRLVGADRRQIRKMVVIEAGLIGLISQALGAAAGIGLALILIYVINVQSFGWTIQFDLPGWFLVQMSAALTVATALAGVYPARVAAAIDPVGREDE
jgi:putative ABC transport system permease protein